MFYNLYFLYLFRMLRNCKTSTCTYFKGKENGKTIMRALISLHIVLLIHLYALAQIRMVRHVNRGDVSGAYRVISIFKQCVTGSI